MPFLVSFGVLSAAFLSVAALERIPALQFRPAGLFRPYLGTDALWYVVFGAASAISAFGFQPLLSHLAVAGAASRVAALAWPVQLFAAAATYDFVAFAVHVTIHRLDPLWNVHKVHHSSQHLDWLATTRTHMSELFVRNIPAQAVLFTLGFSARTVAAAIGMYVVFVVLGHSNLRLNLNAVEPLFVTPRLHRRHHVPATTQKNFGTIFSIWDRLFGLLVSLETSVDEPLGVPGERTTYPQRFRHAAREPFRQTFTRRTTTGGGAGGDAFLASGNPGGNPPGTGAGGIGASGAGNGGSGAAPGGRGGDGETTIWAIRVAVVAAAGRASAVAAAQRQAPLAVVGAAMEPVLPEWVSPALAVGHRSRPLARRCRDLWLVTAGWSGCPDRARRSGA